MSRHTFSNLLIKINYSICSVSVVGLFHLRHDTCSLLVFLYISATALDPGLSNTTVQLVTVEVRSHQGFVSELKVIEYLLSYD